MNKVIAITKFNQGHALVLRDKIKFNYEKHGNILIGIDDTGTFVDCLIYERPTAGFKAFGGREFNIELTNGETVHCNGQWWHGGFEKAEKILGSKLVSATVRDIESLEGCYVFSGCCAIKDKYQELIDNYEGRIFGNREFENLYWNKVHVEEKRDDRTISYMKKVKNPDFKN